MKASVLLLNIKLRLCCSFMEYKVVLYKYSKRNKKNKKLAQSEISL